jgi:hypothetical protein
MNTPLSTKSKEFSDMTKLQKWQHFLRRRFQETENSYYPIVDELVKKLEDLQVHTRTGPHKMPDFRIHQFSFIKDWEDGDKSSREVYSILKTMDMGKVAETSLLRRLDHYMEDNKSSLVTDYILPVKALILKNSVPLYANYLNMLVRYFAKLSETDMSQEKVTWIEHIEHKSGAITKKIEDMTLNQAMRQLDTQVIPFNNKKYLVGKNIICLDEDMAKDNTAVHFIFGPAGYIDELKTQFKITDVIDIADEMDYIQGVIGAYINEKV